MSERQDAKPAGARPASHDATATPAEAPAASAEPTLELRTAPPTDEGAAGSEPLHVACARAGLAGVGAGVGGFVALGGFLLLRRKAEALPMALPAALVFGLALAGAEELARRLRRGPLVVVLATALCPLGLFLGWHWVDGLLRGGFEGGLEAWERALGRLWRQPGIALGFWAAIASPFLGIVVARVRSVGATPPRRGLATLAGAVVGGLAAFVFLHVLTLGDGDDAPKRLLLTLGWAVFAGFGSCVGEDAYGRWIAPRLEPPL